MQAERRLLSRFSPRRTDPEDLETINVKREDLLARSVAALRESVLTENKHHLLFIGPRGSGKSHLLALIFHRLQGQPDLAAGLRVAWLSEDETSTSFLDLLLRIYRALAERYPAEFPSGEAEGLVGRDYAEALDLLCETLIARIGRRTVLVMLENLDSLFSQLDESDQRAWRALIQNHPVFATAATAQSLFAGVSQRDEPFFGFFDTTRLQPLTAAEATDLLQRIARLNQDLNLAEFLATPHGKARVQAIHHLSGGNPRLYIILSDCLTCQSLDELVRPFEGMVDELTPFYQERLRWLSPQQRKIVDFLCRRARPAPVKEIAAALFAEQTSIAGQLLKLREMGYVRPNPRGRESLYELAEPLMRLSMETKNTRDRQPLRLLVDFLRVWFERGELEELSTQYDKTGIGFKYLSEALEKLQPGEPDLRRELLLQRIEGLNAEGCDETQFESLRELAEDSQIGRIQDAINDYSRAAGMAGASTASIARALFLRAVAFGKIGRDQAAVADLTRIIKLRSPPTDQVSRALVSRGMALTRLGRNREAEADMLRAIETPGAPADARNAAYGWLAFLRLMLGEWNVAQQPLEEFLGNPETAKTAVAQVSRGVVHAIFSQIGSPMTWQARVVQALALYKEYGLLDCLGGALVQHLAHLKESPLGPAGLGQWLSGWEGPASSEFAMQFPLRLLRAGIAYLKTQPRDEGVLLELPSEERTLVRQALGLKENLPG